MGIDNRVVGSAIAALRKNAKMTQLQLAYTLNVSHQAVSKWESGAALPDIQTLLTLTQLFGVTMEQLLSGDLPHLESDDGISLENDAKPESSAFNQWIQENIPAETRKTINDLTKSAYRTASDFAAKVSSAIGLTNAASPDDDAAQESIISDEDEEEEDADISSSIEINDFSEADEEDEEDEEEDEEETSSCGNSLGNMTLSQLIQLAPFMSRAKLSELAIQLYEQADWNSLTALAPFLSRSAMDELARKISFQPANRAILVRLAPFVSKGTLYELILANLSELKFDDLRPFCPFLGHDMVDELFNYFTTGRPPKAAQKKAESKSSDVSNVISQTINGIEGVLNGIGTAVSGTIGNLRGIAKEVAPAPQPPKPARAPSEFKDRVARAAVQSGNWDWLANHYTEIGDQSILLDVAIAAIRPENRARTEGMLPGIAQLLKGDKLPLFFDALAENEEWELIASLRDCVNEAAADAVARRASESGKENAYAVIELLASKMSPSLLEQLADRALADNDWLLINALTDGQDRI